MPLPLPDWLLQLWAPRAHFVVRGAVYKYLVGIVQVAAVFAAQRAVQWVGRGLSVVDCCFLLGCKGINLPQLASVPRLPQCRGFRS